ADGGGRLLLRTGAGAQVSPLFVLGEKTDAIHSRELRRLSRGETARLVEDGGEGQARFPLGRRTESGDDVVGAIDRDAVHDGQYRTPVVSHSRRTMHAAMSS